MTPLFRRWSYIVAATIKETCVSITRLLMIFAFTLLLVPLSSSLRSGQKVTFKEWCRTGNLIEYKKGRSLFGPAWAEAKVVGVDEAHKSCKISVTVKHGSNSPAKVKVIDSQREVILKESFVATKSFCQSLIGHSGVTVDGNKFENPDTCDYQLNAVNFPVKVKFVTVGQNLAGTVNLEEMKETFNLAVEQVKACTVKGNCGEIHDVQPTNSVCISLTAVYRDIGAVHVNAPSYKSFDTCYYKLNGVIFPVKLEFEKVKGITTFNEGSSSSSFFSAVAAVKRCQNKYLNPSDALTCCLKCAVYKDFASLESDMKFISRADKTCKWRYNGADIDLTDNDLTSLSDRNGLKHLLDKQANDKLFLTMKTPRAFETGGVKTYVTRLLHSPFPELVFYRKEGTRVIPLRDLRFENYELSIEKSWQEAKKKPDAVKSDWCTQGNIVAFYLGGQFYAGEVSETVDRSNVPFQNLGETECKVTGTSCKGTEEHLYSTGDLEQVKRQVAKHDRSFSLGILQSVEVERTICQRIEELYRHVYVRLGEEHKASPFPCTSAVFKKSEGSLDYAATEAAIKAVISELPTTAE